MRWREWLQEIRLMRIEDAFTGLTESRLSQELVADQLGGMFAYVPALLGSVRGGRLDGGIGTIQ